MTEEPELGIRRDERGVHALGRVEYEIRDGEVVYANHGPVGVMVTEEHVGSTAEPTLRELSEALITVYGTDYGAHSPTFLSRFTDATRQAAAYRDRRVLLAGDAAHVHAPDGGQGLNIGVQDAVNLGWKLAQVVERTSPDSLLDTYDAERHPVAARVLRTTMAQVALRRPDDRTNALRDILSEIVGMEEPRRRLAAELSGLGIRYDLGDRTPAARTPHARSRRRHRRRPHPRLRLAARRATGAAQPRRAWRLRHQTVGGSGPADRRDVRRYVGASGARAGHCPHRRADSARRLRGSGSEAQPCPGPPAPQPPGSDPPTGGGAPQPPPPRGAHRAPEAPQLPGRDRKPPLNSTISLSTRLRLRVSHRGGVSSRLPSCRR